MLPSSLLSRIPEGFTVIDEDDDDPILVDPEGNVVETWREGYPYDTKITREEYEQEKRLLPIELLKLQYWVKDTGQRIGMAARSSDSPNGSTPAARESSP